MSDKIGEKSLLKKCEATVEPKSEKNCFISGSFQAIINKLVKSVVMSFKSNSVKIVCLSVLGFCAGVFLTCLLITARRPDSRHGVGGLETSAEPEYEEKVLGEAEVRKLFKFSKVGTIAGSYVTSGVIKRGAKARVIRDGVVVNDSIIATLAREKDQAKEVKQGLECGITIENFNDIKEKDIIEAYELKEVRK